jgi:hypothetical protein
MTRNKRTWTGLAAAALVICSTFSTGCDPMNSIGSINLIVPMGLGGSPGYFNPFGITQAIVNSLLGISTTTTESTAAFPIATTGTTPPTTVLPGVGPV